MKNRIFYRYQSGFRAHHSTDTCLSYLSDKILQGFETGKFIGMILIDLQKAFDTIDHKIFLDKLVYLGFSKSAILWFKSYLLDRSFTVNIGKDRSLRRLLLNALIQPHFDYACTSWYPGLTKRLSKKNPNSTKQMHSFLPEFENHSTYLGHRIQGYKLAPHKEQN